MSFKRALFFLLIGCTGQASQLRVDTRFTTATSGDKILDAQLLYRGGITSWLDVEAGAKYSVFQRDFYAIHSKGELVLPLIDECSLNLRVHHVNYLSNSSSLTHVMPYLRIGWFPFPSFGVIGAFGWYERWGKLSKTLPIPTFTSHYREHDFVGAFGFEARPTDEISTSIVFSTVEEIEVYNLNNPFFEGRVSYRPEGKPWTALAYFRYKVLLGFGRWDELTGGVGYSILFK